MKFLNNMTISPEMYAEAAIVAREAAEELLSRLDWMTLKPAVVLNVGSGAGELSRQLQDRYSEASIIALDLEVDMLKYGESPFAVCAEADKLPLPAESVDLIFANFYLPWQPDIQSVLKEWRRVLRPDGLLMWTALGADTFKEYLAAFSDNIIPHWLDMHDMGDLMLKMGFSDPVLDACHYTTVYRQADKLINELQASRMLAAFSAQQPSLLPAEDGTYELTYEVIHAHAFAPSFSELSSADENGVVKIPLSRLRRK